MTECLHLGRKEKETTSLKAKQNRSIDPRLRALNKSEWFSRLSWSGQAGPGVEVLAQIDSLCGFYQQCIAQSCGTCIILLHLVGHCLANSDKHKYMHKMMVLESTRNSCLAKMVSGQRAPNTPEFSQPF